MMRIRVNNDNHEKRGLLYTFVAVVQVCVRVENEKAVTNQSVVDQISYRPTRSRQDYGEALIQCSNSAAFSISTYIFVTLYQICETNYLMEVTSLGDGVYKRAPLVHILPAKYKMHECRPYYFTTYPQGASSPVPLPVRRTNLDRISASSIRQEAPRVHHISAGALHW